MNRRAVNHRDGTILTIDLVKQQRSRGRKREREREKERKEIVRCKTIGSKYLLVREEAFSGNCVRERGQDRQTDRRKDRERERERERVGKWKEERRKIWRESDRIREKEMVRSGRKKREMQKQPPPFDRLFLSISRLASFYFFLSGLSVRLLVSSVLSRFVSVDLGASPVSRRSFHLRW